jgi:hypothetical protein
MEIHTITYARNVISVNEMDKALKKAETYRETLLRKQKFFAQGTE